MSELACVILAGGRGKRMASADRHKVCFPVVGRPAIVRAIDTYKEAGLHRFLVVVGQMADQVIATVSAAHPEVTFVYQSDARGTGHAALMAAEALAAQGHEGAVLVVMGDKIVRSDVIKRLIDAYEAECPDVLVSTLPKLPGSTAGRVVSSADGTVLGVVEVADIRKAVTSGETLDVAGKALSGETVEGRSAEVNASLYVFRFAALHRALRRLSPSNAQGELYLTDTVACLAAEGTAATMLVPDPDDILAFNTPAELLAAEEAVRAREGTGVVAPAPSELPGPDALRPAKEWLALLERFPVSFREALAALYGASAEVLEERRRAMKELVQAFMGQYGPDREMIICRAPGRINLMGRHVDHRGGFVNVMAINREVLVAAAPRPDDVVRLRNLDVTAFPNREFRIFDLLGEESWTDWMNFLESHTARRVLDRAPGDWSHYVRAPLLRLQYERRDVRLRGMDCMVSGNIPMGAGLSSSSALVVAFAEAAVALNGLDLATGDFVDLCGEGEWFVGSRGGSADHAAIRTGQLGHVSKIGFFPFRLVQDVPFPDDLRVVIAHSGSQAIKSAGARDVFNQRVACYGLAELLIRHHWPAAAGMEHLRDLVPKHLGVTDADVFCALLQLPDCPPRDALAQHIPRSGSPRLASLLATHCDVGDYDLRGVALFGISECIRSDRFAGLLRDGDTEGIRRAFEASHDGDRVVRWDTGDFKAPFRPDLGNETLAARARAGAALESESGRYACSTEDIDFLVDLARALPGVLGAQLAGAGLGGCMMVLVEQEAVPGLLQHFRERFYAPRELELGAHVCSPVAGAGLVAVG